jgi:hypothetical protein
MPAPAQSQSCHPKTNASSRVPWAELLRRVWHIEALRCEHAGGAYARSPATSPRRSATCGREGSSQLYRARRVPVVHPPPQPEA